MTHDPPPASPYAPPAAVVEDRAAEGQLQLASRGARLGAALIDMVIGLLAMWVLSRLTPWNPFSASANIGVRATIVNQAIGFAAFVVLHGFTLWRRGQTLGKVVVGVRIVRSNGAPADPVRLFGLRYFSGFVLMTIPMLGLVYSLVDALFIFGQRRRCVHDLLADTVVIRV